jgi:prepilin-type N-terminal cleavage/methylation domain-containing protein
MLQNRAGFTIVELLIVILAIGTLAAIAIPTFLEARQRALYAQFQANAHQIGIALENFAVDHQGRYPGDGVFFSPPPGGFSPGYINWNQGWRIDYEVHGNGSGGTYIGLEYSYPTEAYQSLCNTPANRTSYPRGESIPGTRNRIWIFHEGAPIMP